MEAPNNLFKEVIFIETHEILNDLYLFSSYLPPIDLTFNQFLVVGKEPLLVHTGSLRQTQELLPLIKKILSNQPLSYLFISHFESDECGGLQILLEHYPNLTAIGSAVTDRQLTGFGITQNSIVQEPGSYLETGDYKLLFIDYPSEMHLWPGLLAFETNRNLLFSSDLFGGRGKPDQPIVTSSWPEEIQKIAPFQIPALEAREKVQQALKNLQVRMIAPGHGPCIRL